jgi:drug/metabolite transporter (DMT)-like permease
MNSWRDGVLLGSAGVLCFSGTAPATRLAVAFGPAAVTAGRIVIAAALGALTLLAMRRLRWPGRRMAPGIIVAGLGQAVGYPLFLALAVQQVPANHAAVVIGLTPAATAALSAVRTGERLPGKFWWACVIGFVVVTTFAVAEGGGGVQAADAWLLAAVLSTAVGYVEGGRISAELGGTETLCWAMILLSPAAAVVLAVTLPGVAPGPAWVGFGYAGIFSMFLGSVLWYRGLAAGGISRIGQLNLAQPFLAITWSSLLLGEHLTWAVPVTAAVVLACVAVCLRSSPNANRSSRLSTRCATPR